MANPRSSLSVVIASGLLGTAAAQAGVVLHAKDCTGCSTAQIEALAPNCDTNTAYISDFASGNLYEICYTQSGIEPKFVESTNTTSPGQKTYHWYTPQADYENTFQIYKNVYDNNGHVRASNAHVYVHTDLKAVVNVGGDNGYMNAFDTVAAPANDDAVANWLQTTNFTKENVSGALLPSVTDPSLEAALVQFMNSFKSDIINFNWTDEITVVFNDGSQNTYTVSPSGDWVVVANTAKDSHGNPIPASTNMVSNGGGTAAYGFGGSGQNYDLKNLQTLLTEFGAAGDYQGGGETVTCTWDGVHNTLTCTIRQ